MASTEQQKATARRYYARHRKECIARSLRYAKAHREDIARRRARPDQRARQARNFDAWLQKNLTPAAWRKRLAGRRAKAKAAATG